MLETRSQPFYNPAQQTNPSGKALARSGEHYQTRECGRLFNINKQLIRSASYQYRALQTISEYLTRYRKPLVLKDPQLLLSLPYWLEGALWNDYQPIVAFTCRDEQQIACSWKKAPFTRHVLQNNPLAISVMRGKQAEQKRFCIKSSIAYRDFYFDDLIKLRAQDSSLD